MRIFVSGIDGQLAQCLAKRASQRQDITVICRGRPDFDLANAIEAERQVIELRPDVIINAAAYTAVDKAESEPRLAFAINCEGAAAMARAASTLAIPLIQISTDYVFSGNKISPYVETDDIGPMGVYGQSKLAAELIVRNTAQQHAILRTSWVYSPYGNNFVKTMIRLGHERKLLRVVSDQLGCPTSAMDLADAAINISHAMLARPDISGLFHVAGQGETNWAEFAKAIFAVLVDRGIEVPEVEHITTAEYPTPAKRPANSRLDCSKLHTVFGFQLPEWQASLAHCMTQLESSQQVTI